MNTYPLASSNKQTGAILLMLTMVLLVGVATILLATLNSPSIKQTQANLHVLNQANQALIGYALSYPEVVGDANALPGRLPCPDFDGDGDADSPCNGQDETSIGRLPWRTLGLPPLRDSDGECLWYVVSGSFKQDTVSQPSSETNGLLLIESTGNHTVIGASEAGRAIALVIAPGDIIGSQRRNSPATNLTECSATGNSDINRAQNFLDAHSDVDNARGLKTGATGGNPGSSALPTATPTVYLSSSDAGTDEPATFNDQLSWIDAGDFNAVFKRMNQWVAERVRACLVDYGDSHASLTDRYPWAARLDASAAVNFDDDSDQRFGRIPTNLSESFTSNAGYNTIWPPDPMDASSTCFNWSWWPQWRNQVFYAVNDVNAPSAVGGSVLNVDGATAEFVVLIAGREQLGQVRASDADRGAIENYLEVPNQPGIGSALLPGGNEDFSVPDMNNSNDVLCDQTQCYD